MSTNPSLQTVDTSGLSHILDHHIPDMGHGFTIQTSCGELSIKAGRLADLVRDVLSQHFTLELMRAEEIERQAQEMKPRLKRYSDGRLAVLTPSLIPWGENSARKFLQEHYGSVSAFAIRFGFSYDAVCAALRGRSSERMAGNVATVRQVLGLPSNPSKRAIAVANGRRS